MSFGISFGSKNPAATPEGAVKPPAPVTGSLPTAPLAAAEAKAAGSAGVRAYDSDLGASEVQKSLTHMALDWNRGKAGVDHTDIFQDAVIHFFENGKDKENLFSGFNLYRTCRVDSYRQAEDLYVFFSQALLAREHEFVGLGRTSQDEFNAYMDEVFDQLMPRVQRILDGHID